MANQVQDAGPPRLEDFLFSFEGGMDSGTAAISLAPNVMAYCTNGTVRGDFLSNRPAFKNRKMTWDSPATMATVQTGLFQGSCYATPDAVAPNPTQFLVAAISGRLFVFRPAGNVVSVSDVTPTVPNPATQPQAWLWQAEKWVIWNDGLSSPVFLELNTLVATRSNYAGQTGFGTTIGTAFTAPAQGATISITFAATANMNPNDVLQIQYCGHFTVVSITSGTIAVCQNNDAVQGSNGLINADVNWSHNNFNLPPGRMGAYVLGRNWMALTDGKQFIASDITGGPSGTAANNYRDAVLQITENTFLIGGGNFSVPGSVGDIAAIIGLPTLDASLGQGPVIILCPKAGYSCNAPSDRTTWSSVTNPILAQTMLTNAGLGQNGTVTSNSDVIMRAIEGVRSLIMTRNDFATWGNTVMSYELLRILPKDNPNLLNYCTAIVFDNRMLMSAGPLSGPNGVYHQGLVALNFDPKSTLKGKEPSVWEGVWTGLFPMQMCVGNFGNVERAWAFTYNPTSKQTELHEILTDEGAIVDDTNTPIGLTMESPFLFKDPDPRTRKFKRLFNGEIYVDDLIGTVNFYVFYRPDFYPGWIPWFAWTECQSAPTGTPGTANYQPGFRPVMGIGEPSGKLCDPCTNRPFREGFTFQVKIEIVGHCIFRGARFEAIQLPKPTFAKLGCTPICS